MSSDFSFAPDGARAARLDRAMHAGLADSLFHIGEAARGHLQFDDRALSRQADAIRQYRFGPLVFGRYYELVRAIDADDLGTAQGYLDDILSARPLESVPAIFSIGDARPDSDPALYQALMDADPTTRFGFLQPDSEKAAAFRDRLAAARARFAPVLPELFAEVDAIVSQVVLASSPPDAAYHFDGGSNYQLWGALFLNPAFHATEIDVVEVVAHESAHSLLFGFTTEETLVLNPDEDLFPSPLRVDPRPMDGIYHATFVSARMHWAMAHLLASGTLSDAEAAHARKAMEADAANFASGAGVVAEHGDLTETGRQLFAGASAYMEGAR